MKNIDKIKRYGSINGLRVLACICIVLMHVRSNLGHSLSGQIPNTIIKEFSNFVFLFMIISAFGMCCGYFNKIRKNEINPEQFYSKRILKLLPFFLFLVLIDIVNERSVQSVIEGFTDSTLLFGFIQKDITVVGVGWFIGLIFVFYLMFPYFTYLFSNKKRAWFTTIIAILMNYACVYYFNVGRTNMFYSFIYFCIGGLVYLYKDDIAKLFSKNRIIGIVFIILSIVAYYFIPLKNEYLMLVRVTLLSISLLCYAISYKSILLDNKITKFIGDISFEIYLSHMMIFRVVEKFKLSIFLNNNWLLYIVTTIIVIVGSIVLSIVFKKVYSLIEKKVHKNENTIS